jgi:DNA-binding transcriptional LysR family regulator
MRPQELNLLVIFDVIMTEKSITRAAEQLSMTQPAVSNAVAKMRAMWKDELFVKDGRGIQATTYAKSLWTQVRDSLHSLNLAIKPDVFDASTSKRTFRIAISGLMVDILWLELRLLFEQVAPGISLHAIPYTTVDTQKLLEDSDVDIVIGAVNLSQENILSSHLYDTVYKCVMRKDHLLADKNLTVDEFANAEHLLVSLSGDTYGAVDKSLNQLGLSRHLAMTVNHFSSVAPIISCSDLIATLPSSAIYKYVDHEQIAISHPPIKIQGNAISMLWHKRQNTDAGLKWLRQQINDKFVNQWSQDLENIHKLGDK